MLDVKRAVSRSFAGTDLACYNMFLRPDPVGLDVSTLYCFPRWARFWPLLFTALTCAHFFLACVQPARVHACVHISRSLSSGHVLISARETRSLLAPCCQRRGVDSGCSLPRNCTRQVVLRGGRQPRCHPLLQLGESIPWRETCWVRQQWIRLVGGKCAKGH